MKKITFTFNFEDGVEMLEKLTTLAKMVSTDKEIRDLYNKITYLIDYLDFLKVDESKKYAYRIGVRDKALNENLKLIGRLQADKQIA